MMTGIARREVLLAAFAGPIVLAQGVGPAEPNELPDFDGTPIQRIRNGEDMSETESEHLIKIDLPAEIRMAEPFKATFSLPNHPLTGPHHVTWLRVFVGRQMITYVTFAPLWQHPEVTFTLELTKGHRIEAVAACNRHGLWGAAVPITIIEPEAQPAPAPVE